MFLTPSWLFFSYSWKVAKSLSLGRGCFELVNAREIQEDKKKKENDLISILGQILLKFPEIFKSQFSAE